MTIKQIYELFLAELANRKSYEAYQDTVCHICDEVIEEGGDFIFLGGEKICEECQGDIETFLEEQS